MTKEPFINKACISEGACHDIAMQKLIECEDCISRKEAHDMVSNLTKWVIRKGNRANNTNIGLLYDDVQFGIDNLSNVYPKTKVGHNCNKDYADCDQFVCSECGIELQNWDKVVRDDEYDDISYQEYAFSFCPCCGCEIKEG